jgi:thiol-disulfide isomerase/thioredoxin
MKKMSFLLLLIALSCVRSTNNPLPKEEVRKKDKLLDKYNPLSDKVIITGTTDDIIGFQYLNIVTENNIEYYKPNDFKKEVIGDSLHLVLSSIDKPLFAEVSASGKNKNFYRGWFFLIPGDTISIRIKEGKMVFNGENAIYNNFYAELDENTPQYNRNPYKGSLINYKKDMKSIYDQRTTYYHKYIEKYNIESEYFLNTITTNLRHRYLHNLISPANVKAKFLEGWFFNESDILNALMYKEQSENPEVILDLNNYFETITLNEFKSQHAFDNSMFFRLNINGYIRDYFLKPNLIPFSREKFIAEKEFIETNFEGDIKVFAIKELIKEFHRKGLGKSKLTINLLKSVINEYEEEFTKPSYIELINKVKEDLNNYAFELSSYALNSKFININGDTLSLKKIFARSQKRIKVVDFWASWCPPCIQQINEGKAFKDRLQVENNVEWIYISPERNHQKWLEANKKYKHVLNFHNSFFLLKGRSSVLSKFFKINEVPRYIIFDKENTIILNNAPSPSDNEVFESIIDELYGNKSN